MPTIIALGTNIGDKKKNLETCLSLVEKKFNITSKSRIYCSEPVDYLDQDDFYNQVIEIETPDLEPEDFLTQLKRIEIQMGRNKIIDKGPRLIDLDIIFIDFLSYKSKTLKIPHPSVMLRSFVIEPLKELPFYQKLKLKFEFPEAFSSKCQPL